MRLFASIALMLVAVPVAAQESTPQQAAPHGQATPQENLDCALWAFSVLGSDIEDVGAEVGLSGAAGWFLGLYEGQMGTNSEQAMRDRAETLSDAEIDTISGHCAERMVGFGEQLLRASEAFPPPEGE